MGGNRPFVVMLRVTIEPIATGKVKGSVRIPASTAEEKLMLWKRWGISIMGVMRRRPERKEFLVRSVSISDMWDLLFVELTGRCPLGLCS